MGKFTDMMKKVAEDMGDPDSIGMLPGAIVEPYFLYFEEEEKKAKDRKQQEKPKQQ